MNSAEQLKQSLKNDETLIAHLNQDEETRTKMEFVLEFDPFQNQKDFIMKYFMNSIGLSLIISALGQEIVMSLNDPYKHFDKQKVTEKLQNKQQEIAQELLQILNTKVA